MGEQMGWGSTDAFTQYRGWMCELLPYVEQDNIYRPMFNVNVATGDWFTGFFNYYGNCFDNIPFSHLK